MSKLQDSSREVSWGSWAIRLLVGSIVVSFFLPWIGLESGRSTTSHNPGAQSMKRPVSHQRAFQVNPELRRIFKEADDGFKHAARDLSRFPQTISGIQILRLANARASKSALDLLERVTGTPQQPIGLQSSLVYLVPGLALLIGVLAERYGANRWLLRGLSALCLAVAMVGCWKLIVADAQLPTITFAYGLWWSMAAYALLAPVLVVLASPSLEASIGRWIARRVERVLAGGPRTPTA